MHRGRVLAEEAAHRGEVAFLGRVDNGLPALDASAVAGLSGLPRAGGRWW